MFVKFTPEEAQLWIDLYQGAQQLGIMRRIRPEWAEYLAYEMRRDEFQPTVTIALAHYQDMVAIVNGNHTLRAIVRSGASMDLPVEEYRCNSVQEVRDLYATFDIGKKRTRSDSFQAYAALDILDIKSITKSDLDALASSVQFIEYDFSAIGKSREYMKMSNRDLLAKMKPWAKPYGELLSIVGNTQYKEWYNRIAKRRGICSVAIITLRYQPEKATKFWSSIATGNVTSGSATLKLRDYLLTTYVAGGGKARGEQVNAAEMTRTAAYCWNKYWKNEGIAMFRVRYDMPPKIEGTPFDGKSKSDKVNGHNIAMKQEPPANVLTSINE